MSGFGGWQAEPNLIARKVSKFSFRVLSWKANELHDLKAFEMFEAKDKAPSTWLTADVELRVKAIAQRENRYYANVIESAG